MNGKYNPLEQYLRSLPLSQEEVTINFQLIENLLNTTLPTEARQERAWWGNQKQEISIESIPWMDAGWMVDTVDLHEQWVHFVRQ